MNSPEHRFTKVQVEELTKLLGHKSDINPSYIEKELVEAGRWFTSDLVRQDASTAKQDQEKLRRIAAAAEDLNTLLDDADVIPYLRYQAGDVLSDDRGLSDLSGGVQTLCDFAMSAVRRLDQDVKRAKKSGPKKAAMYLLIHRLSLVWLHARGEHPKVWVSPRTRRAGGEFIKFVQLYIKAMSEQTKAAHIEAAPTIANELKGATANIIHWHVKGFNKRLKPSLKAAQGEVTVRRGRVTTKKGRVTTHRIM